LRRKGFFNDVAVRREGAVPLQFADVAGNTEATSTHASLT
jgi:hypothetical protein